MQRILYCVLVCLSMMNVAFSQVKREKISEQFDKIASLPVKDKDFTISAFLGKTIFVLQGAKDSLLVTCYTATENDAVREVRSIFVNNDSLFVKAVQSLFTDIKQKNNYQPYSKAALANGNFFLTFNERNKLQMVSRKEASTAQQKNMNYLLGRLNAYSFTPEEDNERVKVLHITNINELLKFLM
ncbi:MULTISPECIES: hypothetical protein [Niastella]|uniref:Uncharacterized protein n=1 Tax=Niastella soli TaxID=2821487 RepID=A0ABS3Z539_9BACT|nr:hypothetical protein [Niastella soli]MBO9204506.1 hypothetical protein [Niastella soli]